MSDCKMLHERGPTVVHDHQSCIACRYDGHKNSIEPYLTPGVFYKKCTLLVRSADDCEPLSALSDLVAEKDLIQGVTKCDVDLTEVTEDSNYPCGILTNVDLDPNYICWPEGATKEQIEVFVRNFKGCVTFSRRFHCSPVPPQLRDRLESDKAIAAQRATIKTFDQVPVTRPVDELAEAGNAAGDAAPKAGE